MSEGFKIAATGLRVSAEGVLVRKQSYVKDGVTNFLIDIAGFGYYQNVRLETRDEYEAAPAEDTPVRLFATVTPSHLGGLYRLTNIKFEVLKSAPGGNRASAG